MKLAMVKVNGALHPDGEEAIESFNKLVNARTYMCNVTMPRNLGYHKKFFAMVNILFDMQEKYKNKEVFRKLLIIGAGYFTLVTLPNGRMITLPDSVKFESMAQDEFEEVYSGVIDVAMSKFGIDREAIDKIMRFA